MRCLIATRLFGTLAAAAQQTGQNAPLGSGGTVTFSTGTQLVVETVAVTDKQGNPVEGLTAKDFTVSENGVPQAIRALEYQKLGGIPNAAPALRPEPEHIHVYDK